MVSVVVGGLVLVLVLSLLVGRTGGRAVPDSISDSDGVAVVVRVTVVVSGSRDSVGVIVMMTVDMTVVGEDEIVVDFVVVCVITETVLAMPGLVGCSSY